VRFPITQAHPTEVVFTIKTLHMIAAAILFDANMTFRTVFCVCTNVIGGFTVVSTFGEPFFYHMAFGGCVIVGATTKAEGRFAIIAHRTFWCIVLAAYDYLWIR
jgi:hypothetical protein